MQNGDEDLIKTARQFDVHVWSEHPEINLAVRALLAEIIEYRENQLQIEVREPEKLLRNLKPIVLDLWVASAYESNPWIGIGLNERDYQVGSRYKKLFLKYDRVRQSLETLHALGYIERSGYFNDPTTGRGRRRRYKATLKLLNLITANIGSAFSLTKDIEHLRIDPATGEFTEETIRLKDANKRLINYLDDDLTTGMRARLEKINLKLANTRITLKITNDQFLDLNNRCRNEGSSRPNISFFDKQLYRVFNNGSFDDGGRFYGGWWMYVPREYRPYIEINHGATVELDYSGHHLRLLYALKGIQVDEVYDVDGYSRDDIKQSVFSLLNTNSRRGALASLRKAGFDDPIRLLVAIEDRHPEIKDQFYKGIGIKLMREDSDLAEEIMLKTLDLGGACLPVHDSFIVKASRAEELKQVMDEVFYEKYGVKGILKPKLTARELDPTPERYKDEDGFIIDDLAVLLSDVNQYTAYKSIFGY